MSPLDRCRAFLDDIESAPAELSAVLHAQRDAIADLPLGALARPSWRFIAMGSSRFAALDAAARLRSEGRDAHAETASAADGSPGGRDTLVVVISASGRTAEAVAAAERHHGASFVLGLAARASTPLADLADAFVPLGAAYIETAGIASLTYRATVAALYQLGAVTGSAAPTMTRRSLADGPPALRELLAGREAWVGPAADLLHGGRTVHVLADGSRIGVAEQAALMLREAPRIPAAAFDTGDWLHVGQYTLYPGDPVLLFSGADADAEVIATIHRRGGRVVVVGPARDGADVAVALPVPCIDPIVRSLVEPAVAELLAQALWARTAATDLDT